MNRMWFIRTGSVVACFALAVSAVAQDAGFVARMTTQQAECISTHAERYLTLGTDPVIVIPDNCPNVEAPGGSMMATLGLQNSGADIPMPKEGDGDGILVLMLDQIICLRDHYPAKAKTVGETDLIEFDFGQCPP